MSEANTGLLGSIRRLLSTLVSVASTRLALLANELYEERLHWEQMLLNFFAALFCLAMGLLLLTLFIVVLFWDSHRLAVLGGMGGVFMLAGLWLAARFRRLSQRKSSLFSLSLAELQQDKQQLDGRYGQP